jgi:hypothetical protein
VLLCRMMLSNQGFSRCRIWDSLGFTRAGVIPRAGRLRRADGNGEEWVDSVIYYQSFVDDEEWARPIER